MNPRERAIRLADLSARQRRAARAADGLHTEYLMTNIVNMVLDAGQGDFMRQVVADHPGAGQEWRDFVIAMDKQEREEAELEKTLARRRAAELQSEAQQTLRRAGIT